MSGLARQSIPVALFCLGFLLWSSRAAALTRHVPSEYPTIAAALTVALAGDVVEISCGTYFERALIMKSDVTLRSESGDPSCVTIDAEGIGRVMLCQGVSSETRFEGITFSGGVVGGYSPFQFGAGILCTDGANPRIVNCVFANNVTRFGQGGGLACVDSSPLVQNCVFRDNEATGEHVDFAAGGGATCLRSAARFESCIFEDNLAFDGGALYADQSPIVIESSTFRRNVVDNEAGAIHIRSGDIAGEATITDCIFEDNESHGDIGAVSCRPYASPTITRCTFRGNVARNTGALACSNHSNAVVTDVIFIDNRNAAVGVGASNPRFTGCLFLRNFGNRGGAITVASEAEPLFEACTFVNNDCASLGTFLYVQDASPTFHRCIIANHPEGMLIWCRAISGVPFQPTFTCTDIFGNASGDWTWDCIVEGEGHQGNLSADPKFCDPEADDYMLDSGSPCLPGHHPEGWDCGLIGALGEGCGATAVEQRTWGSVKSRFE